MTFHANCLLRRQFAWNVKSCFLGKIWKNIINLSSAKNAQRVIKVKVLIRSASTVLWRNKKNISSFWLKKAPYLELCKCIDNFPHFSMKHVLLLISFLSIYFFFFFFFFFFDVLKFLRKCQYHYCLLSVIYYNELHNLPVLLLSVMYYNEFHNLPVFLCLIYGQPRWLSLIRSDWWSGDRRFEPCQVWQHSFMKTDHEIYSTVILSLSRVQEGQLSVSGKRMSTHTG